MIHKIEITRHIKEPRKGCVIAIPGRGMSNNDMTNFFEAMNLKNTMCVTLQSRGYAWYPIPNGPEDQKESVEQQFASSDMIDEEILKIQNLYDLPRKEIALVGFSAGAVMSLLVGARSKNEPFAGVIAFAGAILDPSVFPECDPDVKKTRFLLQHNFGDLCFEWYERYMPMKKCLQENGYSIEVRERDYGRHYLSLEDVILGGQWLSNIFEYENWSHPSLKEKEADSEIEKIGKELNVTKYHIQWRERLIEKLMEENSS